jgi:putative transposase
MYTAAARRIGSMECVGCRSAAVLERSERTAQGYRRFRCRACGKQFNERSGGSLNRTQYPSDVIALVVLWRLCYKLALRDLPEMLLIRGIVFSHEAVRDWETKLRPALAENLRRRRRGKAVRSWYVDETYIKVHGHWRYLYRAIDRSGALVDVLFSEHRDMAAAKAFFESATMVTGVTPDRVTTDGHDSYPRAIRTVLGTRVRHRDSQYLNNRLEQDHRGVKGRYRPMRRFKCPRSAGDFCRAYRRFHFLRRTATVLRVLQAA